MAARDQLLLQVGDERIEFAAFSRAGRSLRKAVGSDPTSHSGAIDAQLMTDSALTYALGMQLFHRFKPCETRRATRFALGIGPSCRYTIAFCA